jgi:TolB protein
MRLRTTVTATVAALTALVTLVVASPVDASRVAPSARAAAVPPGFQSASAVPWSSVGRGWVAAGWNSSNAVHASNDGYLVLVSPTGVRYLILKIPGVAGQLTAWSGDGRRVLLAGGARSTAMRIVDLRAGAVVSSFVFPTSNSVFYENASFTQPTGAALLVSTQTNDHQQLARFSIAGALQLTYPTAFSHLGAFTGSWISSPDGTELVMGARHGLAVVTNDGTVVRQLPIGGADPYCMPKRWWSTTVVLASCQTPNRLYEFSIAGGTPKALTQRPVPPDSGDLSAWRLGHAVYVQAASACGFIYLARLQGADPVMVHVPGVPADRSVDVIGVSSTSLALEAGVACVGQPSLLWYTPAHNRSQVVLGRPATSGSVGLAVVYPTALG